MMHAQEAKNGISRSHTVDHHQILERQYIRDNLRTRAILYARGLLAIEKVDLQLVHLEGIVVELQCQVAVLE